MQASLHEKGLGEFTLPDLLKVTAVTVPARKKRVSINPFTKQEQTFAAKPATTKLRLRALKKVKDAALSPSATDHPPPAVAPGPLRERAHGRQRACNHPPTGPSGHTHASQCPQLRRLDACSVRLVWAGRRIGVSRAYLVLLPGNRS